MDKLDRLPKLGITVAKNEVCLPVKFYSSVRRLELTLVLGLDRGKKVKWAEQRREQGHFHVY